MGRSGSGERDLKGEGSVLSINPNIELVPHPRGGLQVRRVGDTRAMRRFAMKDKDVARLFAKRKAREFGGKVVRAQ